MFQTVHVDSVIGESELALHVLVAGEQDFWIPRSLIQRGSEVEQRGDDGRFVLPAWFVAKELIPLPS